MCYDGPTVSTNWTPLYIYVSSSMVRVPSTQRDTLYVFTYDHVKPTRHVPLSIDHLPLSKPLELDGCDPLYLQRD